MIRPIDAFSTGDIVCRGLGGSPMRVISLDGELVRCAWFDQEGRIRRRHFDPYELSQWRLFLKPRRSPWPYYSHIDLVEDQRTRQRIAAMKLAARKSAKKPRSSQKIKKAKTL